MANKKNYEDRLRGFEGFMLGFNPNVEYDENDMTLSDEEAVHRYLSDPQRDKVWLEKVVRQCRQVLEMDPFPWEEVADLCERNVWNEKKQELDGYDPESYYKWLEKVTNMLESEAKKRGLI